MESFIITVWEPTYVDNLSVMINNSQSRYDDHNDEDPGHGTKNTGGNPRGGLRRLEKV